MWEIGSLADFHLVLGASVPNDPSASSDIALYPSRPVLNLGLIQESTTAACPAISTAGRSVSSNVVSLSASAE